MYTLRLTFHGDLPIFLRRGRGQDKVVRRLGEKTSVKDAIEACGAPHPEIDLILVDGNPVSFSFQLERDAAIEIYPATAPAGIFPGARLQRRDRTRFVADGHLGKLNRNLRWLGIDVVYDALAADAELVARAAREECALLTRDRRLLMHAAVRDGYYPRSQDGKAQTREVLEQFQLRKGSNMTASELDPKWRERARRALACREIGQPP